MVTGLMLIAVDGVSAELVLTDDQMDQITAGIFVTASDENEFFTAEAFTEGMTAEADAEVGADFGLANGSAETTSALSAEAFSHSNVTSKDTDSQPLSSPRSQVTPRLQVTPRRLLTTSRRASTRVR